MNPPPLTRRAVLAVAVTVPVAAAADPPHGSAFCVWDQALVRYTAARQRHESFLADRLDPAVRMAEARGQGLTARIGALEQHGDQLCGQRHAALRQLMALPAGDLAAVRVKFRLAYDDMLQFEDGEGHLAALLADLERLIS